MNYSGQPKDQVFVKKNCWSMSFAKNMGKIVGKNLSKNASGKYSLEIFDHPKKSARDALKTIEKLIQKAAEAITDLIGVKFLIKVHHKSLEKFTAE